MSNFPKVKEEVVVPILNHTFTFQRLRWRDTSKISTLLRTHSIPEPMAMLAVALKNISGRAIKPDEAVEILQKLPSPLRVSLFKLFIGGLDPHRFCIVQPFYSAPDAATYAKRIAEEEEETDKINEEVEEFLVNRFGRKEVSEEMELGRQMVESTGYAGALQLEQEALEHTSMEDDYYSKIKRGGEEEDW
jgi:hypothetical protein